MVEFRVLELFSGIGGMHYALKYAQLHSKVIAAMDINTVANLVYNHNHKDTCILNNNIQSLTIRQLQKLCVNMLLMSPPCQPHTRQGFQRDLEDNRSDALRYICAAIIPACNELQYILMENVKGFEISQARDHFIHALKAAGFYWREFILTPTQLNVPNTRHRYYCLARKDREFDFAGGHLLDIIPLAINEQIKRDTNVATIKNLLEKGIYTTLPDDVLSKRIWLMDIVNENSTNTMCFTKGYTRYCEGTGSVYTPLSAKEIEEIFTKIKMIEEQLKLANEQNLISVQTQEERMNLLRSLKVRYFTWREVSRLMSFPESFSFPSEITERQRYRLLGNSINVKLVGELLKLLVR